MSDKVVIDGVCDLEIPIEGECGTFYKVNPTSEALTVQPTSEDVTYTPTADYFSEVTVEGIKGERTITENGEYDVLTDKQVTVAVDPPVLDPLTATANGRYTPAHDGYSEVTVDVPPDTVPLTVTANGEYTREGGYSPVTVSLPKAMTADQIATGEDAWGVLTIEAEYVIPSAFRREASDTKFEKYAGISKNSYFASCRIRKIVAPNCVAVGSDAFYNRDPEEIYLPKCVYLGSNSIRTNVLWYGGTNHSVSLRYLYAPVLEEIETHAFGYSNNNFKSIVYPRTLRAIYNEFGAAKAETAIFLGTPTTVGAKVFIKPYWPMLTDIYVPWSEGEVANAPWGATTATIHYDTPLDDFAASWDGNLLQQEVIHPV